MKAFLFSTTVKGRQSAYLIKIRSDMLKYSVKSQIYDQKMEEAARQIYLLTMDCKKLQEAEAKFESNIPTVRTIRILIRELEEEKQSAIRSRDMCVDEYLYCYEKFRAKRYEMIESDKKRAIKREGG